MAEQKYSGACPQFQPVQLIGIRWHLKQKPGSEDEHGLAYLVPVKQDSRAFKTCSKELLRKGKSYMKEPFALRIPFGGGGVQASPIGQMGLLVQPSFGLQLDPQPPHLPPFLI